MTRTIVHGTATGYKTYGCRCDDCRRAAVRSLTLWRMRSRASGRHHRPERRDKVPTDRVRAHIAELVGSGLSYRIIDDEAPLPKGYTSKIMRGVVGSLTRPTAARILAVEPLPDPASVVDEVAVRRVIDEHADVATLNRAEKAEAIRQAMAAGRSWPWIQRVLRVNGTTVRRALATAS